MRKLDEEGRLYYPSSPDGRLLLKRFLDEQKGNPIGSVWTDVDVLHATARERRGYPTQKPLALLERIIAASCPEGGTVLDPFCGCGTAVVAAERMGRNWIGIDVTYLAINEIVNRLATETKAVRLDRAAAKAPVEGVRYYRVLGTPTDETAARALFDDPNDVSHKEFEKWAVTLVDAKYNPAQGADGGIDGRRDLWDLAGKRHPVVVQVKGGNALTLSAVRDFARVIEREKALIGVMIAQREPTKDMLAEAAEMGTVKWADGREYARYQILTTKAILEEGARADLPSAVAYGHAPDAGVGQVKPGQASLLD